MNKLLIKEIIKFKIYTADKVISHMPPEIRTQIRKIGKITLDELYECVQEVKNQPNNSKSDHELDSIEIE